MRRRSRPPLLGRWRAYWLVAVVCAVVAAAGAYVVAALPAFRLAALSVTGLAHLDRADVVRRAAIDPHANIWLLDRRAIEARIAALPYVASARVHRRPLANVWLEVHERTPEACVTDAAHAAFLVDGDLRVLALECGASHHLLRFRLRTGLQPEPGAFLHDSELQSLQRDARLLGSEGTRIRALRHDGFGGLDATLGNGIAVRFGDDGDLQAKSRLLGPILAGLGPRTRQVRVVDLRAPGTPVVEYRAASGETQSKRPAVER